LRGLGDANVARMLMQSDTFLDAMLQQRLQPV
jgi:hypothetical protein